MSDKKSFETQDQRRDAVLKRMLNTPPKPHKPKTTGDMNPRKKRRKEKG